MKPFVLQVGEVLVDRGERRQAEATADFLQARRVAVLLDEIVEVIEDFPLALGQWQHGAHYTQRKSESQRARFACNLRLSSVRSNQCEAC